MPELPEVETIRRDLAGELIRRRITDVEIFGHRTVRRHAPDKLIAGTEGRGITAVRRWGKFLFLDLDDEHSLFVHLRMSGQLLWLPDAATPPAKHTHAVFHMEGGGELRFVDPRTFGELWLSTPDAPELQHLGPDAYDDLPEAKALASRLRHRRRALKTCLLDQTILAGIGNIYSDEILWMAKLASERSPDSLSSAAFRRLHDAIATVLAGAVTSRGSSLSDSQYVDLFGHTGTAQLAHNVYAREFEPCPRCPGTITRKKVGGRSAYFCPRCQR